MMAGIFHLSRENEITFLPGDDNTLFAATNFEENLKRLVAEIFDPAVPFDQTQDYKRCTFCDFAGLCRRN